MSAKTDFNRKLMKATVTGVIAGGVSKLLGESSTVDVAGMDIPTPIMIGGANAVSSIGADYAHDYVFPRVSDSEKFKSVAPAALGLAVSGGASALLLNREIGGNTVNAFALGAASYAAGDYLSRVWWPEQTVRY